MVTWSAVASGCQQCGCVTVKAVKETEADLGRNHMCRVLVTWSQVCTDSQLLCQALRIILLVRNNVRVPPGSS